MKKKTKITLCLIFLFLLTSTLLLGQHSGPKPLSEKQDYPLPTADYNLLIRNINIVDTETGDIFPNMNVFCAEGKIKQISSNPIQVSEDVMVVDGTNQYLTPGYLNMHMHVANEPDAHQISQELLSYGITGYRQMSGSYELLESFNAGEFSTSTNEAAMLTMPIDIMTPMFAPTVESAKEFVDTQKAEGAPFIKSGGVTADVFFSALEEAQQMGLRVEGHILPDVDLKEASQKGVYCVDHFGINHGALISCSTDEASLRAISSTLPAKVFQNPLFVTAMKSDILRDFANEKMIGWATKNSGGSTDPELLNRLIETFSEEKARELAITFRENDTWQCPTMVRMRSGNFDETDEITAAKVQSLYNRLVKIYEEEHVKMIAGTDGCIPSSLHDEFDELDMAGLEPLTVLQMVTINGAEFLNMTDTLGSINEGKNADMVILAANPLEDIQNLHKINGVIRAGEYHPFVQ